MDPTLVADKCQGGGRHAGTLLSPEDKHVGSALKLRNQEGKVGIPFLTLMTTKGDRSTGIVASIDRYPACQTEGRARGVVKEARKSVAGHRCYGVDHQRLGEISDDVPTKAL